MAQHTISVEERVAYEWHARCRCGWAADPKRIYRTRDSVMDEVRKHETQVERARAARRWGGSVSLTAAQAHYQAMADNPEVEERDRVLWQQLADEVARRIGEPVTVEDQPELDLLLATEE